MTLLLPFRRFRRSTIPTAVLMVSLLATLGCWRFAAQFERNSAQAAFTELAQDYQQSLEQRMATYLRVMLDLQGFFQATGGITRQEFDAFAQHIGIDRDYPGILRMGYIPVVPAADRSSFEARIRAEGFPDYRIRTNAQQPYYYPVDYLYPMDRQVMGLEMSREPVRQEGLEKARDLDQPVTTRKTVLLSDPRRTPAFFIFVPIYHTGIPHSTVAERRRAIQGYVFAAFLAEDLLRGTLGANYQQKADLAIFDGTTPSQATLLYATSSRAARASTGQALLGLRALAGFDLAGRHWSLAFLSKPKAVPSSYTGMPGIVLSTGLAISLLLTGIAALYRSKRRLKWAKEEQNQRFRSLFDQHPDAVYSFDLQGQFVDANAATLRLTGLSLEELRKKTYRDVIDPAMLEQSRVRVKSAVSGRASYGETAIYGAKGERIDLATTNLPIVVNDQIVGLFGIARDITEQKRAEVALAETRERLNSILDSMEDGVWSISLDQQELMFLNQAVESIYGRSAQAFYNNPQLRREVIHPDDRAMTDTFIPRLIKEGRRNMRYRIIWLDGSIRWIKARARVIHDIKGRAIRLDGIITDITEQVQAEHEVEKQKQLLSGIIDTLPLNIFIRDAQSRYLLVNDYAAEMLGKSKNEVIGRTLMEIFPANVARPFMQDDIQVLQSGQLSTFEEKTILHGRECYVLAGKTALHVGDGQPLLLGYSIDITKRRQAEEALRRAHDELEDKIRERTEELQQANHALKELSSHLHSAREEERTRLAREIHDELGGTLAAIKFDLSLLSGSGGRNSEEPARELGTSMQLVDDAIVALRRIITDLRPSLLDEVGLWAALEWLASEWQARVNIPCEFELLGDEVELDSTRATALFRIVQEALTNVMKHAQATKVHILAEADENEISIQILDNGIGVPFSQLANPVAFGISGMRERVRAFGGTLSIESRPGKGTLVQVNLPFGLS